MKKRILTIVIAYILSAAIIVSGIVLAVSPKEFTVTFDLNEGTLIEGELVQTVEEASQIQLPKVEREGYHFAGWDKAVINLSADTTVKALWSLFEMTVEFRYTDGTYVSGEFIQKVNVGSRLEPPIIVKEGYTLAWEDESGNIVDPKKLKRNAILTATWVPQECTISFVDHLGQPLEGVDSVIAGYLEKTPILPSLTIDDKQLLVWKVFGTDDEYVISGQPWTYLGNRRLEPVLVDASVNIISYNLNGGTGCGPFMLNEGQVTSITNPTREGYLFAGWMRADENWQEIGENCVTDLVIESNTREDVYLIAKWASQEFEVTFITQEGTFADGTNTFNRTMRYGEKIENLPVLIGTDIEYDWKFEGQIIKNGENWNIPCEKEITVVATFKGVYIITLDLSYDLKLSKKIISPNTKWEITWIDDTFYYLHITCSVPQGQSLSFKVKEDDLITLQLPQATVVTPTTRFGDAPEFAFGEKWRYYYSDGYVDFKIKNGVITEIKKYVDVNDIGTTINLNQVEQIFAGAEEVDGIKNIVLKPYCKRDWS